MWRFVIEAHEKLTRDQILSLKLWILDTESDMSLARIEDRHITVLCSKRTIGRLFRDKENEFAWIRKIERDTGPKPVFLDAWSSSEEAD